MTGIILHDQSRGVLRHLLADGDNGVEQSPVGVGVAGDGQRPVMDAPGLKRQGGGREEQARQQKADQEGQVAGDRGPKNYAASII
jgi:hypothetical protein